MSKKISDVVVKTTLDTNDAVIVYDSTSTDGSGVAKSPASNFRGNTILALSSDPTTLGTEKIGDLALNKLTYDLFEFNGTWALLGNIKGVDGSGISLPTYSSGTTYSINQSAVYNSVLYRSKTNSNLNNQPDISSTYWEAVLSMADSSIKPYNQYTTYSKDQITYKYGQFLSAVNNNVTGPFDLSQWRDQQGRNFRSTNKNALFVLVGDTISFASAFAAGSTITYEGTATVALNINRNGLTVSTQGTLSNIKVFNGGSLISQYPCQEGLGNGTALDADPSICYDVIGSNNMTVIYRNRKNQTFTFDSTFLKTGQVANTNTIGSIIYNGYLFVPDATLHNISIYRLSDGKLVNTIGDEGNSTFSKINVVFHTPRGLWIDPVFSRLYVGCSASVVVVSVPTNIETGTFGYITHLMFNYAAASTWTTTTSGAGFAGFCYGIVTDTTGQNVYCIDFTNHTIKKWVTTNGSTYAYSTYLIGNDSTTAGTYCNQPYKIRFYNNRLYIANNGTATYGIEVWDLGTNSHQTSFSGWVVRGIDMLYDTVDLKEYIYFVAPAYNRVYRYEVSPTTGGFSNQTTYLPATDDADDIYYYPIDFKTKTKQPIGITVSQSYLMTTLTGGGSVLFNRGSMTFNSFIGSGGTTAGANTINALGFAPNKMFVGNNSNYGIAVYDISSGYPIHNDFLGSQMSNTSAVDGLYTPKGRIAYSSTYNLIVAVSCNNHSVVFYRNMTGYPALGKINTAHTTGTGNYQFYYPYSCWIDDAANLLYVADMYNHRIQIFNLATISTFLNDNTWKGSITTGYTATIGVAGTAGNTNDKFQYPQDVTTDSTYIYVLDTYSNGRIQTFNKSTRAYVSSLTNASDLNHTSNHQNINVTDSYIIVGDNTDACVKLFSKSNFSGGIVIYLGGKGVATNYQYNKGGSTIADPSLIGIYNNYIYSFSGPYRIVRFILGGNATIDTVAQNWNLSQGFKINGDSYLIPSKAELSTPADSIGGITNPAVFGTNNSDGIVTRSAVLIGIFDNNNLPSTTNGNIVTGDVAFNASTMSYLRASVSGTNVTWS